MLKKNLKNQEDGITEEEHQVLRNKHQINQEDILVIAAKRDILKISPINMKKMKIAQRLQILQINPKDMLVIYVVIIILMMINTSIL